MEGEAEESEDREFLSRAEGDGDRRLRCQTSPLLNNCTREIRVRDVRGIECLVVCLS